MFGYVPDQLENWARVFVIGNMVVVDWHWPMYPVNDDNARLPYAPLEVMLPK